MTRTNWLTAILATVAIPVAGAVDMSIAEREDFLRTAQVVSRKSLNMGVTASSKLVLQQGETTHAAHIQTIDESKPRFEGTRGVEMNFRDSYKFNIAAYELAKLLDLNMVPVSVARKVDGSHAAVTWWVDDARMTELERRRKNLQPPNGEEWNRQMAIVKVFDELILNTDRNQGNLVITNDWQIHMIDHTRAFRLHRECPNLKGVSHIERNLLEKLRGLEYTILRQRVGAYLTDSEIKSLLARRDRIVSEFDSRIEVKGKDSVVYELSAKYMTVRSPESPALRLLLRQLHLQASN